MTNMSFDAFKQRALQYVKEHYAGDTDVSDIRITSVGATNGAYTGLIVMKSQPAAPVVNLDIFYNEYRKCPDSLQGVLEQIIEVTEFESGSVSVIRPEAVLDDAEREGRFRMIVRNKQMNREKLKSAVYEDCCDLAITYTVLFDMGDGRRGTGVITKELLKSEGWDKETVIRKVRECAARENPAVIRNLADVAARIQDKAPDPDDPTKKVFIVTTKEWVDGAAALFYPGVMEELSEAFGGSFYVLPSSTNEWVTFPDNGEFIAVSKSLDSIIRKINETCVPQRELLSGHAYRYDAQNRAFSAEQ